MLTKPAIYAHRGGAGYHIENTLAAFEFAIELGCAGAELDVHLTKDNQIVVHHNAKLNHLYTRKPNGQWLTKDEERQISELTLEELKQYTVGEPNQNTDYRKKFPKLLPVENQTIPTLQEVIQLAKQKSESFRLLIEIKTDIFADNNQAWLPLVDAVLNQVEQENFTERAEYCSFDWRNLIEIKKQQPTAKTWFTTHPLDWLIDTGEETLSLACGKEHLNKLRTAFATGNAPWYAGYQPKTPQGFPQAIKKAGGDVWFAYWKGLTSDLIEQAHTHALAVAGWTNNLNNPKDYKAINALSLNAQCIDYPNYRFIEITPELQQQLDLADKARKAKNWQEAKTLYELIYRAYGDESPAEVYWKLAISYRRLKLFDQSMGVLSEANSFFPNQVNVLTEIAALNNAKKKWSDAVLIWNKVKSIRAVLSKLDYERMLIALENMNCNDQLYSILEEAIVFYPENKSFSGRFALVKVKKDILSNSIDEFTYSAFKKFKLSKINNQATRSVEKTLFGKTNGKLVRHSPYRVYASDFCNIRNVLERYFKIDKEICAALDAIAALAFRTDGVLNNYLDESTVNSIKIIYSFLERKKQLLCLLDEETLLALVNLVLMDKKILFSYYLRGLASEKSNNTIRISSLDFFKLTGFEKLVENKIEDYISYSELDYTAEDRDFKEYVAGKSIAIVGPVNNGILSGDEIDNSDIVIRFNYKGLTGYEPCYFGTKTNISLYLDHDLLDKKKSDLIEHNVNDLDWVLFRNTKLKDFSSLGFNLQGVKVKPSLKIWEKNKNPFFKGFPNALQIVLFDIFRFHVGSVKLFNMDFFVSTNYESSYMRTTTTLDPFFLTWHDLTSNFAMPKALFNSGLIEADEIASKILRLSVKDYMEIMDKTYSNVYEDNS
ncbi:glycerophosphodiester phosphodiesterase family protein [Thiomicrospira cyclica]|uniref:Glycerophosphoryl diester phosphodiesterase n=1 Tax=Thiomicrospira cyclica (strain DSM 14477 / JCM 11371 / ALM1) TaxID=717773 RepID=F6DCV5_THICA|nr:glycerophosphodiester phosphodiesterase family protein [Thiomicrospira cyclica]AEG31691.1 glycerophosphoryl diester phosphodiesterase [Thiomicrospira cyclica ALM1]